MCIRDRAEFSRILLHLAQRRGFKSNRRTAADGEDGRLLAAVNENRRRMAHGGWRTVVEMLYRLSLIHIAALAHAHVQRRVALIRKAAGDLVQLV